MTQPASQPAWHVALDVFEGPLDLLLRLIERQELDISRVSLALVADQYLAYTSQLSELTSEFLADFLVVAAKLLVIKSRALLPAPVVANPQDEEDDGEQLTRQLAEYKRYKLAAQGLRALEERGWHTYLRLAPAPKVARRVMPGSLEPGALITALLTALYGQPAESPLASVDTVVQPVAVYISECITRIRNMLAAQSRLPLSQAFVCAGSRLEVIVLFLAVLELIKQQQVLVQQSQPFGEIMLEPRTPDPDIEMEPALPEDYGESEEV